MTDIDLEVALVEGSGVAEVLRVVAVVHGRGADIRSIRWGANDRPSTLDLGLRVQADRVEAVQRAVHRSVCVLRTDLGGERLVRS